MNSQTYQTSNQRTINNSTRTKELFTIFYVLSTILNGYASGISSLSLGMIGYAFFCVIASLNLFVSNKRKQIVYRSTFHIFVTILFVSMLSFLFIDVSLVDSSNMLFNIAKLIVWVLATTILAHFYIDFRLLKKVLLFVAIVCTIYLYVQFLFYFVFHLTLTNLFSFGFLKPNYDYYFSYSTDFNSSYRPASFFAEPAFYGYFIILVLVFILFSKEIIRHKMLLSLFLSIGLFLSTSSNAIYLSIIIWIVFFVYKLKGAGRFFVIAFLAIFLPVSFVIFTSVDWETVLGNSAFGNMFSFAINKISNFLIIERIGGSFNYLKELNETSLIFGVGIGNEFKFLSQGASTESFYLNAVTTLIFWSGYLGFTLFTLFIIVFYIKSNNPASRFLIVIYFISGFYSGLYFSIQGILYLVFIVALNLHYISNCEHKVKIF